MADGRDGSVARNGKDTAGSADADRSRVGAPDGDRIRVGVADAAVTDENRTIVTSGLGSCVGIALYDDDGVGGLLHAMLPDAPETNDNAAKYVDSGIEAVLEEMEALGADRRHVRAKLTGGSSMLDLGDDKPVGEKNVEAAVEVLREAGIELVADETGGDSGRSVSFDPETGVLQIKRVEAEVEYI